jgi:hypothetical protein
MKKLLGFDSVLCNLFAKISKDYFFPPQKVDKIKQINLLKIINR